MSGTVTYHRAEYLGDVSYPWEVWFDGGQGPIFFTAAEGEAMGLTPPEPAPLVVTCKDPECPYPGDCFGVKENGRTTWRWPRELVERYHPDAVWPQPEQDDTASGIDFDALPIGTVIADKWRDLRLRQEDGWLDGDDVCDLDESDGPYTVVYQPAPLSPGEHLRGLLAGRDDADELIEWAALNQNHWPSQEHLPNVRLTEVIRDAAREVHGG